MRTKAKRKEPPKRWFQFSDEEKLAACGQDLPEQKDKKGLVAEILRLLQVGHDAMMEGNADAAVVAHRRIECCVLRRNGDGHFGSADASDELSKLVATEGVEPLIGQPGRYVQMLLDGRCRALVTFDDLGSLGFHATPVDFDRPFLSKSGYMRVEGWHDLTKGDDTGAARIPLRTTVGEFVEHEVRKYMARDAQSGHLNRNADGSLKLRPLEDLQATTRWQQRKGSSLNEKIEEPMGPDLDDPAWKKGGWLHKLAAVKPKRFTEPGATVALF